MIESKILTIKPDETQLGKPLTYDVELYLDIRKFIEEHLDLVEEEEYDVLVAKVIESWLIFKMREIGYIFFVGPPRSGKTRALETLAALCYNPKIAGYMSGPAVYRTIDAEWCTLFLDEIQQYLDQDKSTFMAILNAGQRRGQKAIIMVNSRSGWDAREFDVFCSKFMASTEETAKALSTRCIIIPMVKNARRVPLRIDTEWAKKLRGRLDKYASRAGPQKHPDVEHLFTERNFTDYRNIETFINLVMLTPPQYRSRILRYAKKIDDQIAEEEGINFYAELFAAIEHAYQTSKGGKIAVASVAEVYNDGRSEHDKLANKTVGTHLNIMGLRRKCRMTGGRIGRYVSEKLMARLRRRYGPMQRKMGEESEGSEESEGKRGEGVGVVHGHTPSLNASLSSPDSLSSLDDTGHQKMRDDK